MVFVFDIEYECLINSWNHFKRTIIRCFQRCLNSVFSMEHVIIIGQFRLSGNLMLIMVTRWNWLKIVHYAFESSISAFEYHDLKKRNLKLLNQKFTKHRFFLLRKWLIVLKLCSNWNCSSIECNPILNQQNIYNEHFFAFLERLTLFIRILDVHSFQRDYMF